MGQPATLVIAGGSGAVLALAGPFGTDQLLGLVARLAYWLGLVFATYSAGVLVGAVLRPKLAGQKLWQQVLAVGSATALAISGLVLVVNWLVFGWLPSGTEWAEFLGTLFVITLIVTAAINVAAEHLRAPTPADASASLPPILERLPLDKRGALVALSVEDHYVRVHTTKGEELLLMRLSDAMREVGPTQGDQVHRSHWAAFGQVTAARREGDRAILTMRGGAELPVSRANVPKIKEAGLLPR